MKIRVRTIGRVVLGAMLLILVAGVLAPFLSGQRFAPRIRTALEASLHRGVEFGDVRFNLFHGPGFSLAKVVIRDAPEFGREPLAYVESLEAQVSLHNLLSGRLRFSNLRLEEPSLNVARNAQGVWNFEPLLRGALARSGAGEPLPRIQVRSGRVNFRFGDLKSIFNLSDADIDLAPYPAPEGGFGMRFEGQPARSDRAAQPFGSLRGRLRWRPARSGEGRVAAELEMEKSPIGELMMLAQGHDSGLHGLVSAKVEITGAPSNLDLAGSLRVEDIHRWDLMPSKAMGWPLNCRGHLSLTADRLDLDALTADNPGVPVSLRFRASELLAHPRWGVVAELHGMPAANLIETARHVGVPLPARLTVEGAANGAVGYSPESGFQGMLGLESAAVHLGASPLRLEKVHLVVADGKLRLEKTPIRFERGATGQVSGELDRETQTLKAAVTLHGLPIEESRRAGLPLLERLEGGTMSGPLEYRQAGDSAGEWSGELEVAGTRVPLEFLAIPLAVSRARVRMDGTRVRVRGLVAAAGEIRLSGEYQYQPGARRPHSVHLVIPRVEAGQLERALAPALRRQQGFLARTLRLGRAPLPEWLMSLHAEGSVEVGEFMLAGVSANDLRAQLYWDGAAVDVPSLRGRIGSGTASGWMAVDLKDTVPAYRLGGAVQDWNWKDGAVSFDAIVETAGTGKELLGRVRLDGDFRGQDLHLGDQKFEAVSGHLEIAPTEGWHFRDLRLRTGRETLVGQGASSPGGSLAVDLSGGQEPVRLTGTLFPFALNRER
jgi:hypothetical protein